MTDVFTGTKEPVQTTNPLETLVGEGKKFATVDDLAKGKLEADAFIERLTQEQAQLRADLGRVQNADQQLIELRAEVQALRAAKPEASKDNTSSPLTVDGIKALVAETITRAERDRTVEQNINAANASMVDFYGDVNKASTAVQAKAAELGLSMEALKDIAAKSPSAFQKIILGDAKVPNVQPLDSKSVNNESPRPVVGGRVAQEGTKEYFEEIRKKNPKLYWSPSMQQKVFQAAKAGTYDLTY